MDREKPVRKRTRRKDIGDEADAVKYTAGEVRRINEVEARRGPKRSQAVPMASRANIAPVTDAIPALPMSVAVRLRLSRMIGMRGGVAKVETKQAKKDIQDK